MKPRVLVVEDDSSLRLALCDNLDDEGYAVSSAATLADARAALKKSEVDVIVLDLMLPDGDGTALCRSTGVPAALLRPLSSAENGHA